MYTPSLNTRAFREWRQKCNESLAALLKGMDKADPQQFLLLEDGSFAFQEGTTLKILDTRSLTEVTTTLQREMFCTKI